MGPNEHTPQHARTSYPAPTLSPHHARAVSRLASQAVIAPRPPGVALFRGIECLDVLSPADARQLGLNLILQAEISETTPDPAYPEEPSPHDPVDGITPEAFARRRAAAGVPAFPILTTDAQEPVGARDVGDCHGC
jgi:hypothetical protein